ncbi:MAG TPA: alkaline phosphatase family protein [Candidatus Krumholzibacteria bacterium]|nr:alkaline phosphatase family protein [Candidatus Krumholzibacteria bacterium]
MLVVVDQLRGDLLQRYADCWRGGFRRLLDQGACFTKAVQDHAVTNTGPGHATLATGVFPARHGIVDNSWCERIAQDIVVVPCVADSTTHVVGSSLAGASPHRLLSPTLAEWMQAADARSHVVALGGKDRASILLAGKARGDVYWFSRQDGRFVTSSWYAASDPDWLQQFNASQWQTLCRDSTWMCEVPVADRSRARVAASSEGDGTRAHAVGGGGPDSNRLDFVHRFDAVQGGFWEWWNDTPFPDAAILSLAAAAVSARGLGEDDAPDLLALGLSQTDLVGHEYGPLSLEQLDNLLRLDRALGTFLEFLDTEVGRDRWVMALSADHGVTDLGVNRREDGIPVQKVSAASVDSLFDELRGMEANASQAAEREQLVAARVAQHGFIAEVFTYSALESAVTAEDSFLLLFRHSHHPGRFPLAPLGSGSRRRTLGVYGIEARLQPWAVRSEAGAAHGSPSFDDRHVPILFLGARIPAGSSARRIRSVDVAPTLAQMARIPAPAGLDGNVLELAP